MVLLTVHSTSTVCINAVVWNNNHLFYCLQTWEHGGEDNRLATSHLSGPRFNLDFQCYLCKACIIFPWLPGFPLWASIPLTSQRLTIDNCKLPLCVGRWWSLDWSWWGWGGSWLQNKLEREWLSELVLNCWAKMASYHVVKENVHTILPPIIPLVMIYQLVLVLIVHWYYFTDCSYYHTLTDVIYQRYFNYWSIV